MPINVTVCNGKGGVGKTTVSVLLASTLARQGSYRVGFVDMDPQRSASNWLLTDQSLGLTLLATPSEGHELDVIVIDTPPFPPPSSPDDNDPRVLAALDLMQPIFQAADIALVVTSPSPFDLDTTVATTALIGRNLRPLAQARVLYNQVEPRTILGRSIAKHDDKLSIPPLQATLSDRQVYKKVRAGGIAALDSAARTELLAAALELMGVGASTRRS